MGHHHRNVTHSQKAIPVYNPISQSIPRNLILLNPIRSYEIPINPIKPPLLSRKKNKQVIEERNKREFERQQTACLGHMTGIKSRNTLDGYIFKNICTRACIQLGASTWRRTGHGRGRTVRHGVYKHHRYGDIVEI